MNTARLRRTSLLKVVLVAAAAVLAACLLTLVGTARPAVATFPGTNGDIAYASYVPDDGGYQIFTIPPTGGTPVQLTNTHFPHEGPSFSPDGNTIAYTGYDDGDAEIYTIPSTGGTPVKVTNNSTTDFDPSYSPDGKTIIYVGTDETGTQWLYTIPSTGGTPAKVPGSSIYYLHGPSFSPDGKVILFRASETGAPPDPQTGGNPDPELFTMPSTGGTPTRLTSNAGDSSASFSPDGNTIAYSGHIEGSPESLHQIYTIPSTGGTSTQVTHDDTGLCASYGPSFSPDGKEIAYVGCDNSGGPQPQIFTIPFTGGTPTKVTNAATGVFSFPSWGPLPFPNSSQCAFSEILPPVNDASSATDESMSAYKYGSRGVIPAKFQATCSNDPVDTLAEADAHPMKLQLTKLAAGTDPDTVIEDTVTGSANTGELFRFDDADQYVYNIGVKGRAKGTYKITISEANGGGSHEEWFSIK